MADDTKADIALQSIRQIREEFQELSNKIQALEDNASRDIGEIRETLNGATSTISNLGNQIDGINVIELKEDLTRLIKLVDGDETLGIVGIRAQIKETNEITKKLLDERNMIKWMLIGVGLTGVTNLGAVITVLSKAFGGG